MSREREAMSSLGSRYVEAPGKRDSIVAILAATRYARLVPDPPVGTAILIETPVGASSRYQAFLSRSGPVRSVLAAERQTFRDASQALAWCRSHAVIVTVERATADGARRIFTAGAFSPPWDPHLPELDEPSFIAGTPAQPPHDHGLTWTEYTPDRYAP